MGERLYPPSPRRVAQAHDEGDVARAPLLASASALAIVVAIAPALIVYTRDRLKISLEMLSPDAPIDGRAWLGAIAPVLLAPSVALAVAAYAAALVVGGARVGPPRIVDADARLGAAWGSVRAAIVSIALVAATSVAVVRIASEAAWRIATPTRALAGALEMVATTSLCAIGALLFAGACEAAYARARWRARWSMTRAERDLDQREGSGDPRTRARLRATSRPTPRPTPRPPTITDRA